MRGSDFGDDHIRSRFDERLRYLPQEKASVGAQSGLWGGILGNTGHSLLWTPTAAMADDYS